jgi:hypothetical protein
MARPVGATGFGAASFSSGLTRTGGAGGLAATCAIGFFESGAYLGCDTIGLADLRATGLAAFLALAVFEVTRVVWLFFFAIFLTGLLFLLDTTAKSGAPRVESNCSRIKSNNLPMLLKRMVEAAARRAVPRELLQPVALVAQRVSQPLFWARLFSRLS